MNRDPVLSVECKEPEGTIVRHVYLAEIGYQKLQFIWEKVKGLDVLFNDYTRGDFRAFVDHFLIQVNGEIKPNGLIWEVDDVGIFLLNDLKPAISAEAHFIFWDLRFRGRENLCREMLRFVFDEYKFKRISLRVPLYAAHTLNAVDRIGFVNEGRLRKASFYKDDWFDVNIYSFLPEDFDRTRNGKTGSNFTQRVCFSCGDVYNRKPYPRSSAKEDLIHGT